jgi:NAD(P)-dependent dehydrogenase (short-subunit alcohol dehydrogenase family)
VSEPAGRPPTGSLWPVRSEAESLVSEIQTRGGRANAISADLANPDGVALLAKQVRSIVGDRLDVLVLNAGISKAVRIADYTVDDYDNLFATNPSRRSNPPRY